MPAIGGPAPLRPWETAKKSYSLVWENRVEFVKIAWCWLALAAPVVFLFVWLNWTTFGVGCERRFGAGRANVPKTIGLSILLQFVVLSLGVSIAVAWHRLILRGERPAANWYLRFDGVVWSYFFLAAFLLGVEALPSLVNIGSYEPGGRAGVSAALGFLALGIIELALSVAAVVFGTRVSVLLPARALGLAEITVGDAWRKTRGNFWRLFWGWALCGIPFLPLLFLVRVGCGREIAGPVFYSLGLLLGMVVCAPVSLSFLSLSYQHFFENGGVGEARDATQS